MFAKMPFAFGAGMCYITGTNVMIRARAAFSSSRFAMSGFTSTAGDGHRQIYSENEISEDIEIGARLHANGWKSVLVNEVLATGEV
jgi:cellulose synthase/poly-beta-1,6-N-acetylglucosamine synthase-like glycosyltransferase